jgi:hypothetical protein
MNFTLISIERKKPNKYEHHVEYSLNDEVKTATIITNNNSKEEYKVILGEKISNGEFEEFVKNFIILAFKEQKEN